MKPKNPKDKWYKDFCYCYSKHCDCWKVYHHGYSNSGRRTFMAMDFDSERLLKDWINKKIAKGGQQ